MEQTPETALVILVPEVDPFLQTLRIEYGPKAADSIPAHITINYPFLPRVSTHDSVFQRLSKIFSNLPAFDFVLNQVGKFPGILYLKPTPENPFQQLVSAVVQEFPESPPYSGTHQEIIPHLTVAHSDHLKDFSSIEDELERKLRELLPISCHTDRASYLESQAGAWKEKIAFDLGPLES